MTDYEKELKFIDRLKLLFPFEWKYYQDLISHETMSRDELDAYNFKRRVDAVRYAYDHTIFYRRLYDSVGLKPDDIKDEKSWDSVPLVTKEDMRNYLDEMVVPGTEQYQKKSTTSGSTGFPLTTIVDKEYHIAQSIEWRARGWCMGRPRGHLTFEIPILGGNEGILRRLQGLGAITPREIVQVNRVWAPLKRFFFDSQSMTVETIRAFMEQVQEEGICHLYGYVGTVKEFAERILDGSVRLTFKPRTITCGASVMTKTDRNLIFQAFGVMPHDIYGCNEVGRIGVECVDGEGDICVFSDVRHVDLVDENNVAIHDQHDGYVVITNLDTRVMPIIKYKIGDITRFVHYNGNYDIPFPRLSAIKGRETDYLTDKQGKKVFGVSTVFDDEPECVRKFQYVEHAPGIVTMLCVRNQNCVGCEKQIDRAVGRWKDMLKDRVDFQVKFVEDIKDNSGKIRYIIHEWQDEVRHD